MANNLISFADAIKALDENLFKPYVSSPSPTSAGTRKDDLVFSAFEGRQMDVEETGSSKDETDGRKSHPSLSEALLLILYNSSLDQIGCFFPQSLTVSREMEGEEKSHLKLWNVEGVDAHLRRIPGVLLGKNPILALKRR
jgi:hypothetical protein